MIASEASVKHLTFNARKLLATVVAVVSGYAVGATTPALAKPPAADPPTINLDAFDALKKTVQLPDGETLAYLTMGNPDGTPVVLIHGYTDNARDWVPLVPYLPKHF